MTKFEQIKVDAKYRFQEFKADMRFKMQKAKDWAANNKEFLIIAVPVGVSAIAEGRKVISQVSTNANRRKEQDHRDYDVWDPSAGVQIRCKRKLSNADRIEISMRRANGESTAYILKDMGLI